MKRKEKMTRCNALASTRAKLLKNISTPATRSGDTILGQAEEGLGVPISTPSTPYGRLSRDACNRERPMPMVCKETKRKRPYTEHECMIAFHEPIDEFQTLVGAKGNQAQRL